MIGRLCGVAVLPLPGGLGIACVRWLANCVGQYATSFVISPALTQMGILTDFGVEFLI